MSLIQVLFVDDDNSLQLLAAAMLDAKIFRVLAARSSKEAEQILAKSKVDLVVCDVMMPDEDGLTFCNRLKEKGSKIPFMILSATGDPKSIQQGMAMGANEYLVKPFDIQELQRRMLAMIGREPEGKPAVKPAPETPKFLNWFRR